MFFDTFNSTRSGKRRVRLYKTRPHQGKQEMARRRRQIERGQLTVSNGLVRV